MPGQMLYNIVSAEQKKTKRQLERKAVPAIFTERLLHLHLQYYPYQFQARAFPVSREKMFLMWCQ